MIWLGYVLLVVGVVVMVLPFAVNCWLSDADKRDPAIALLMIFDITVGAVCAGVGLLLLDAM